MGLRTEQIREKGHARNKKANASNKWEKNQTSRKIRRLKIDDKPAPKKFKGWVF